MSCCDYISQNLSLYTSWLEASSFVIKSGGHGIGRMYLGSNSKWTRSGNFSWPKWYLKWQSQTQQPVLISVASSGVKWNLLLQIPYIAAVSPCPDGDVSLCLALSTLTASPVFAWHRAPHPSHALLASESGFGSWALLFIFRTWACAVVCLAIKKIVITFKTVIYY